MARRSGAIADFVSRRPVLAWWAMSLGLAVLSALVLPTVPSYDPWSWIVWGREVTDPHLSFFIGGGPSWKPLPFLFTTVYGPLGSAAPTLWVITERTGALAGLIAAFRLSSLLCGRAGLPAWAGWTAGVFAALGIVLTSPGSGFSYYFYRGASEPILIACTLWAIDRLIAGRHVQAYLFAVALGLMRPEAWPFLLGYGAWLFWTRPHLRLLVVLGLIAQPIGWFVPPWISTGQPLLAATHASEYNGHLGASRLRTVLSRGESLQPFPSLALALAAVLLTLWRGRDRLVFWLAGGVLGWWIVVVAMTLDGYPGLQRFYLPAAAVTCVLSGLGLMLLAFLVADAATGRLASHVRRAGSSSHVPQTGFSSQVRQTGSAVHTAIAAGVVALLLLGSAHFLSSRWAYARRQQHLAAVAVTRIDALGQAVAALGGRAAVLPCRASTVTINHSLQTALAWKLGTTLERVQTVLREPGLAFVGPWDSIDGGPPPIDASLSVHRPIRTIGPWRIFEVYAPGSRPRCVGS
jgi:hypothetical protein